MPEFSLKTNCPYPRGLLRLALSPPFMLTKNSLLSYFCFPSHFNTGELSESTSNPERRGLLLRAFIMDCWEIHGISKMLSSTPYPIWKPAKPCGFYPVRACLLDIKTTLRDFLLTHSLTAQLKPSKKPNSSPRPQYLLSL